MSDPLPPPEARARLGSRVRHAAHARERTVITDRGQPVAVLVSAAELAGLEDALALARYRRQRQAAGTALTTPHDEVRARLGLERG
ncbi:type II toxin-antitoxin system Phd/YefM family antitoxin [Streptomyces sp. AC536]|uniref:type II toxin-antitoxin system Phd/YefM family antitoxin n=1 Tax=Streptomyces buecherae TaxID=2763006 RepID=UPI00164D5A48|nr:type II toxin-antitoxin system Phd/YefM family antitoxin [Streptomyces buecherae]MBC3982124.1 type II toxin-antitoxin system Phd/YefM family antitoxin [Streptomyces buecherae]QNJ40474.1 type II toxin-antitoxin system Phd/YefM family antitoxin [Streptomyces buecherae]